MDTAFLGLLVLILVVVGGGAVLLALGIGHWIALLVFVGWLINRTVGAGRSGSRSGNHDG